MDRQTEREILAAHAEHLNTGLKGAAAYPPMSLEQRHALGPLLQLAERLYQVLVPVEPAPAFVHKLGRELAQATAWSQLSLLERYRKTVLLAVATLGSTLSLVGLVLFYLFRQRDAARGTPAT